MTARKARKLAAITAIAVAAVIVTGKLLTNTPRPAPLSAAELSTINLVGYVRDMAAGHPDFSRTAGTVTVSGSVGPTADSSGLPSFAGAGKAVTGPWRDRQGRTISAPLFAASTPPAPSYCLTRAPRLSGQAKVDSWDPAKGPYGPSNVGPAPSLVTSFTMPAAAAPAALMSGSGDVNHDGNANAVLDADVSCAKFVVQNSAVLTVRGQRTVVCSELFKVFNRARIALDPGASLTVCAYGEVVFRNHVDVNANTFDPARFTLYNVGSTPVTLSNNVRVVGALVSAGAEFRLANTADWFGTLMGQSMTMDNTSGLHLVNGAGGCGTASDSAGSYGAANAGGITSAESFAGWFSSVPGVNAGAVRDFPMTRDGQGVYSCFAADLAPIDGALFGNQGQEHNRDFTVQIKAAFETRNCSGQFIEVRTNGDAWVFIDNTLVVDIGGMGPSTTQYVEIDRLRLNPAARHWMTIYYAQGSNTNTEFGLRMNIPLIPGTVAYPPTNEGYD